MTDCERLLAQALMSIVSPILALVGYWIISTWKTRRYADWVVIVEFENKEILRQQLGGHTVYEWLSDPWARKVGLKSAVSDADYILNVNVLDKVTVDRSKQSFIVKLFEEDASPRKRA